MSSELKIATIFSGIGAPEWALSQMSVKFSPVFACEIDKFARQSYLANHAEPLNFYSDVCELEATKYAGEIDILIGGSPCQDFSIAGVRAGEAGERGSLIWQFYRVVSEARPKIFIYENVKGFLSINHGKSYQRFLGALRNLGYHCYADVVNTKDYGIPQNRERIYIVGFLDSELYHAFEFAPKEPLRLNLGDMLDDNIDEKYTLKHKFIPSKQKTQSGLKVAGELELKGYSKAHQVLEPNSISPTLMTAKNDKDTPKIIIAAKLDIKGKEQIKRVYDTTGLSPTIHTAQGGNQEPKILQRARGFNKGAEFELCPTISTSSFENNNLLNDGFKIRKLTPRECLRLQGFNDDFKLVVSDTQAYKQAGNAMSVNVLKMIFSQILKAREQICTN